MDTLSELIAQSGFRGLTWQNLFMFGISGLLIYLAVKKNYEPLLLIPSALARCSPICRRPCSVPPAAFMRSPVRPCRCCN